MKELAVTSQVTHTLTVLSGSDRGTVYELVSGKITIGRDDENAIVIRDDPKVSRQHAQIVVGANGVQISNTSEHNKIFVNNQVVESCRLNPGTIIQLGNTKLMFQSSESPALKNPPNASHETAGNTLGKPDSSVASSNYSHRAAKPKGNRPVFYTIVAAVILLVAWLVSQNSKTNNSVSLGSSSPYQSSIKTDQQIVNEIEAQKRQAGMNTPQYHEAQKQFIKGFTEYEKGQYSRAIESFQACVTLFPRHPECEFYKKRAEEHFQELIQYELNLGTKFKAQGQYSACAAAYRNVMFMVQNQLVDSEQKIYDLARAGHDACIALGGRDN